MEIVKRTKEFIVVEKNGVYFALTPDQVKELYDLLGKELEK